MIGIVCEVVHLTPSNKVTLKQRLKRRKQAMQISEGHEFQVSEQDVQSVWGGAVC